jgi:hypothetical protein
LSTNVSEVRTASIIRETSVDNHFTRQYIPEDNSEHQLCFPQKKGVMLIALKNSSHRPGLNP